MDTSVTPSATTAGRRLGYARVSTADQDDALQIAALEKAGVDALYVDHGASGTETSRPRFDVMLADLLPGDSVVVYSLSRLSRGMKHLVELGEKFEAARSVNGVCSQVVTRFDGTTWATPLGDSRLVRVDRASLGLTGCRTDPDPNRH